MLINESNTTFVEHIIFVLKNLLEGCSEQDAEHLGEESIEGMVLQLVRLVIIDYNTNFQYLYVTFHF